MDNVELVEGTFSDYWMRLDQALDGLTDAELSYAPNSESNSIAYTVWHMARIEDIWVHKFALGESEDIWIRDGWYEKFGLSKTDIGVNLSANQLAEYNSISRANLDGYRLATQKAMESYISGLSADDLDDVPKRSIFPERADPSDRFLTWSIGRMFRQLFGELNQHLGQVRYIRGMQRGIDG